MTSDRKLRILCLHGFWQNDAIFREKIGSFRKQFKALAEFDFVSAPLIPKSLDKEDRDGARAWWFSKEGSQFSSRDVADIATGFDESVNVVLQFIKENGPYDGIMGFSQGASMVHLLLALKQLNKVQFDFRRMGNTSSDEARDRRKSAIAKDGKTFRVYIHRYNKMYHAFLTVTSEEILLNRSKAEVVAWPLQLIRRYGYTSAGVFFFESGRRCPTGEGLHCFQSQSAAEIFQVVKGRIQETAHYNNDSLRSHRAQSSGPTFRSSISHISRDQHPKVNHIQRYGSEGGGVGSDYDVPASGYHTYHQGKFDAARLRQSMPIPPRRPRSVGGGDDDSNIFSSSDTGPYGKGAPATSSIYNRSIIGNIISESSNPNVLADEDDPHNLSRSGSISSQLSASSTYSQPFSPSRLPYVNISSQEVLAPSVPPRKSSSNSASTPSPSTPLRSAFPLQWDAGAGSTNVICYVQPTSLASEKSALSNTNRMPSQTLLPNKYVNPVTGVSKERENSSSPRLNYALVAPADFSSSERTPSRCSSVGKKYEDLVVLNYTLIDAEKTKALQAAAAAIGAERNIKQSRRKNQLGM